jgi:hypothetical protein
MIRIAFPNDSFVFTGKIIYDLVRKYVYMEFAAIIPEFHICSSF